jgi:phosphoglycolate phosphatase
MTKTELMLFDLDGTLIDSRADLARSINLMLADLNRPALPESQVAGFVGDGVRVLVYRSLTATGPEGKPPDQELHQRGIDLMRHHYSAQMLVETRLYPGVAETLEYFDHKRIGLVTSKETDLASSILDHFGISRYFDCIVGGDMLPDRKPDPGPVLKALELLDGERTDAVMIGDSENDVFAGKRAGTGTCAVTFGFRTEEELLKTEPDVIIRHFEELKTCFS